MASEILSRLCCTGSNDAIIDSSAPSSTKDTRIFSSLLAPKEKWVYVQPGECQLTAEFIPCKLIQRAQVTDTTGILRFSLPDEKKPLNLSTCACILAKVNTMVTTEEKDEDGTGNKRRMEDVIRPYTPISTNNQIGSFDLLIRYYENGKMTQHLKHMKEGDTVDFKHIDFNVKVQAPTFISCTHIGMIVGGTGITPMIQALHAILGGEDSKKKAKVVMLYGSRDSKDILAEDLLKSWEESYPQNFEVVHVLSNEPENSSWEGKRGFINKELIKEKFAPPDEKEHLIMVCGPPPMYNVFCGPRETKEVTGVLGELGYTADQVYKF
jgi:cytochrome-b5 reductase